MQYELRVSSVTPFILDNDTDASNAYMLSQTSPKFNEDKFRQCVHTWLEDNIHPKLLLKCLV